MKFDTIFKLDHSFDDNLFIHHCIPVPTQKDLFYVSLSNGYTVHYLLYSS